MRWKNSAANRGSEALTVWKVKGMVQDGVCD